MPFKTSFNKTVTLLGADELKAMLGDFKDSVEGSDMQSSLETLGEMVVNDMVSNCPVDTGLLQSEIDITESSADSITIESPTAYAGFVNFGTIYQSPQPYFSDAIENLEATINQTITQDLQDMLDSAISANEP